ncbi:MAG: AmmeMemoRadiSam system radical SAM enzyme [Candidatus Thorarchaeota archaeon]
MKQDLKSSLENLSTKGILYKQLDNKNDFIQCYACAHRCNIKSGASGVCKVRYNKNNELYVPFGYVAAWQCDPIEKKPFFHAYPRSLAMSFGMLGCDLHCDYCQNWLTSQALRNPIAGVPPRKISAEKFISEALRYNARVVTSTYNEPLITSEWAVEIFKKAKQKNLATSYVSNGNATSEVLEYIRPYTDLYKIDLKSFNDRNYRKLGCTLDAVLSTIKNVHKLGFWLEIVSLIIPGFNDSNDELLQMAEFISSISSNIPWHVTGFHKDYKMMDPSDTPVNTLLKAAKIGEDAGLNFVYTGNRPGMTGEHENTKCPKCKATLIERYGFSVGKYSITKDGKCSNCSTSIPGIWEEPQSRSQNYPILI